MATRTIRRSRSIIVVVVAGLVAALLWVALSPQQVQAQPRRGAGDSCDDAGDCRHDMACHDGACACVTGSVTCGELCVNQESDERHCGACGNECRRGEDCVLGVCGGADIVIESFDPPVQVSGGNPATDCNPAFEFYPEDAKTSGDANHYGAYFGSANYYNWASAWNGWSASRLTPAVAAGYTLSSDPWASSGPHNGLEYVSYILKNNASGNYCIGIGATQPNDLDNNVWDYPVSCANPLDADLDDGPAIHYNDQGDDLWAVANEFAGGANVCGAGSGTREICLYGFNDCEIGQPGGAACALTSTTIVGEDGVSHPAVAHHEGNSHAIVSYRSSAGDVMMKFYNTSGTLTKSFTVRSGVVLTAIDDCENAGCGTGTVPKCTGQCGADCGAAAGCWTLFTRVHVVTSDDGAGNIYAFIAYDEECGPGPDGEQHTKANLHVIDITNENAPVEEAWYRSSSCGASNHNDFLATPAANRFGKNVGRFFYRQRESAPCDTIFTGSVDANLALASITFQGTISGPFPSMRFASTSGMSHYTGAIQGGLPGGYLFPTWAEPVATSVVCRSCQGTQYNLRYKGTRVIP